MSATHSDQDSIPFYPDHVTTEFRVVLIVGGLFLLVGLLGLFFPVGLGEPADPMDTPAHVKPEWYFLSLYQVLKFVPKTTGVIIPLLAVVILAIWPFLDRKADQDHKPMRRRLVGVVIGLVILVALTIWGEVS